MLQFRTATGEIITAVSVGTKKDIDLAVEAAKKVSKLLPVALRRKQDGAKDGDITTE